MTNGAIRRRAVTGLRSRLFLPCSAVREHMSGRDGPARICQFRLRHEAAAMVASIVKTALPAQGSRWVFREGPLLRQGRRVLWRGRRRGRRCVRGCRWPRRAPRSAGWGVRREAGWTVGDQRSLDSKRKDQPLGQRGRQHQLTLGNGDEGIAQAAGPADAGVREHSRCRSWRSRRRHRATGTGSYWRARRRSSLRN